jgi:ribosomal protein S18 acetylase RimI-like enzyme
MPIDFRLLGPNEASVLRNVAPDVFDDPIDMRAAAAFLNDPRHRLAVAIDGDRVVGFASGVIYEHPDKPRPELWVNEVGVAATHHRRGLGRRLMDLLLADARAAGCRELWVLTDRDNEPAMRLYESVGGRQTPGNHVMFSFDLDAGSAKS